MPTWSLIRRGVLAMFACTVGCADTSEPEPEPEPVPTVRVARVSPSTARLSAVGDTVQLTATVEPAPSPAPLFTWIVRDTLVARVSQQGLVRATGGGTTVVVAFSSTGPRDSMTVRIEQVLARIELAAGSPTGDPNTWVYRAIFRDAGEAVMSVDTTRITWSSRAGLRPTRVQHYQGGSEATFTGVTPGTDSVTVALDAIGATAPLVTPPPPSLAFPFDSLLLGVETTLLDPPVITSLDGPPPFLTYTLSIADTSIATLVPGPERPNVRGLRAGRTTIRALSPGYTPKTIPLIVGGQRWAGFEKRVDTPVSNRRYCRSAFLTSDDGALLRTLRTLRYEAVVADNRVVLIDAGTEVGTIVPGSYSWGICGVTGNPGASTTLVTRLEGLPPDTTRISLSSGSVQFIDFSLRNEVRHVTGAQGGAYQVLMIPDRFPATAGVVRFRHSNPAVVSLPDSVVFQVSDLQVPRPLFYQLNAPGVDTVVATGPGLRGDTLIFTVTPLGFLTTTGGPNVFVGIETRVYVVPLAGAPFTGRIPATVRSSDPSVLEVLTPDIVITSQSVQVPDITVRPLKPGSARVVVTALDPGAATTGGDPIVVLPNPIRFIERRRITLGQRQNILNATTVFVTVASPTVPIRLRSTDSSVARAHIAALPPSTQQAPLDILAGDKVGSAWIVAERPGLLADSVEVRVGKPRLVPVVRFVGAPEMRWAIAVSVRDFLGNPRRAGEPLTVQVSSSDTARVVVEPSTLTLDLNGQQTLTEAIVRYVARDSAAGRDTVFIRVEDPRTVAQRYESGVVQLEFRRVVGQSGRVIHESPVMTLLPGEPASRALKRPAAVRGTRGRAAPPVVDRR